MFQSFEFAFLLASLVSVLLIFLCFVKDYIWKCHILRYLNVYICAVTLGAARGIVCLYYALRNTHGLSFYDNDVWSSSFIKSSSILGDRLNKLFPSSRLCHINEALAVLPLSSQYIESPHIRTYQNKNLSLLFPNYAPCNYEPVAVW